jgi:hypothetical protein
LSAVARSKRSSYRFARQGCGGPPREARGLLDERRLRVCEALLQVGPAMAAVQLPNPRGRFAQLVVSLAYPSGFATIRADARRPIVSPLCRSTESGYQPDRLNRGRHTRASGETLLVSASPVLTERLVASDDTDICSILSILGCWEPAMRDVCKLAFAAMVVLFPTGVLAQLVKCRLPNGTLYIGSAPPPDCGPVSDIRERGRVDSSGASGQSQRKPTPTPQPER